MKNTIEAQCIVCNKTEREIPLLILQYNGEKLHICPQDLPKLIHKPASLATIIPGLANLDIKEHD